MINEDRALLHAGEGTVLAEHHGAQVVVVADAGEDDGASGRRLARGRGGPAAMGGDPGLGLGTGPVVDGDVVALLREVPRHRRAHYAEAQERDFRHGIGVSGIGSSDPVL